MITPEVDALRTEFGLPGMKVLQFAFDGSADNPYLPEQHGEQSVVYTGTHDNDTTAGWWSSLDEPTRERVRALLDDPDEPMPWALIRLAFASTARLAVVPAQDLLGLGSEARMNTPGTDVGNWSWRASPGVVRRGARGPGRGTWSRFPDEIRSPNSPNFPIRSHYPSVFTYGACDMSGGLMAGHRAGESARAAAHTQRVKAEQLLQSAEKFERGAVGEEATADVLGGLSAEGWRVFHDVRWPGRSQANIDHVLVGPSGVFVVDSKAWDGDVEVRGGQLRQDGRRRHRHVVAAAAAAMAIGEVAAAPEPQGDPPGDLLRPPGADLRLVRRRDGLLDPEHRHLPDLPPPGARGGADHRGRRDAVGLAERRGRQDAGDPGGVLRRRATVHRPCSPARGSRCPGRRCPSRSAC